jgi:hypothetical protein
MLRLSVAQTELLIADPVCTRVAPERLGTQLYSLATQDTQCCQSLPQGLRPIQS